MLSNFQYFFFSYLPNEHLYAANKHRYKGYFDWCKCYAKIEFFLVQRSMCTCNIFQIFKISYGYKQTYLDRKTEVIHIKHIMIF